MFKYILLASFFVSTAFAQATYSSETGSCSLKYQISDSIVLVEYGHNLSNGKFCREAEQKELFQCPGSYVLSGCKSYNLKSQISKFPNDTIIKYAFGKTEAFTKKSPSFQKPHIFEFKLSKSLVNKGSCAEYFAAVEKEVLSICESFTTNCSLNKHETKDVYLSLGKIRCDSDIKVDGDSVQI